MGTSGNTDNTSGNTAGDSSGSTANAAAAPDPIYSSETGARVAITETKKLTIFEKMSVVVEFGEYRCSSDSSGDNDETICALKDLSSAKAGQSMAPIFLVIDYGDGSGQQFWHREDTKDLWSHQYQLPGRYWVMVSVWSDYDGTYDEAYMEVEVVDPIVDDMGMEVVCPPVVTPGQFFVCTADIPRGSDLLFSLVMTDDLDTNMKTDTGWLETPQQWMRIPGRPMKTASWNNTLQEGPTSRIIKTSYFKYLANLTAIEYIPMKTGDLYIDIITPACPQKKDFEGKLVDTYWCPLTGACEQYCFSFLQSQDDS